MSLQLELQNCFVSNSACSVDHLSCAGLPKSPVDPCSRESVLKVLKESRKRNVEDEDRSFTTEQRNKRRYWFQRDDENRQNSHIEITFLYCNPDCIS